MLDRSDIKDDSEASDRPVYLTGDAYIMLTAPFFAAGDPLEPQPPLVLAAGDDLDGRDALVRSAAPLALLLRGSLTYEQPTVDLLACFVGTNSWREEVRRRLGEKLDSRAAGLECAGVDVTGMIFPDGYGSIAVIIRLPDGWDPGSRAATLSAFGVDGREDLAAELRTLLLPPLQRTIRRCGAGRDAVLPYFNLTYAGEADHPAPGRSTLDDDLRALVYPDSPMPLTSCSPWRDQFFFAGYAYNLLATARPRPNLEKLALLLHILNVTYMRLARTASAATNALRGGRHDADVEWLSSLERRLRYEHQALVTPTFSYDHHALLLRDAILRAWDTDRLQTQAENLLHMVRQSVELGLAEAQARRIRRVNIVITVLTVLSAIATAEAAVALYDKIFG